MRIHHLQHVPFEDLGSMQQILEESGHQLSATHLYQNTNFPEIEQFDWLIIMGGPMGIYDDSSYPWLAQEKAFIRKAIEAGKIVLGICLGAQLIADVLGAKVYANANKEIGWFDIQRSDELNNTILAQAGPDSVIPEPLIPESIEAFHWHGETFEIPEGAIPFGSSEACKNQGFILNNRVLGLQFHLETTADSAARLIEHCGDELDESKYVQSKDDMQKDIGKFNKINSLMSSILQKLSTQ